MLVGGLPRKARHKLAWFLANVMVRFIPFRRGVVESNLKLAFPDWSASKLKKVVYESFVTLVRNSIDGLALSRMSKEDVLEAVDHPMIGVEHLDALRRSGKGFILTTAHIGDWEWGGAYLAAIGLDLADVAKPLHNEALNKFATEVRSRHNIKLISTEDSPIRMVRHLKSGGVLSLFTDQNVRHDGVFVPFFGRDASTAAGAGYLAYRVGVPVIPVHGVRTAEGRIQGYVDEPIWADPSQPMDREIERITRYHVQCLENLVRKHPGQYFWFHRRWKTRPAAESRPLEESRELAASGRRV